MECELCEIEMKFDENKAMWECACGIKYTDR